MTNKYNPIGVFDSGVGGLSVVKQLQAALPEEKIIYFGDTAHVPYGSKSQQEIIHLGNRIMGFLCDKQAKVIVAACNTSAAVSVPVLKDKLPLPVITVLEPGAEEAVKVSANGRIGIIATKTTVESRAYPRRILEINPNAVVSQMACPAFVPLVEAGKLEGPEVEEAIREYLTPLLHQDIDTLVLGCTHYPFLVPALKRFLPADITIVDPAYPTIEVLKQYLQNNDLVNSSPDNHYQYYCSGSPQSLLEVSHYMLDMPIEQAMVVDID